MWIAYYANGKLHRESTKTSMYGKAKNLLDERLAGIRANTFDPNSRDTKVADLWPLVSDDYKANDQRSLEDVERIGR